MKWIEFKVASAFGVKNQNLLVSPRGDFYFLYFSRNFLLIEVVNPLLLWN